MPYPGPYNPNYLNHPNTIAALAFEQAERNAYYGRGDKPASAALTSSYQTPTGPFGSRSTAPRPSGQGPHGAVPGAIGDVSNLAYDDMLKRVPTLPGLNQQAARGVASRLAGELSPETLAQIQDIGARFGVSSGMPGSGLSQYRTARDLGRTVEDIQRAGLQDYGSLLSSIKSTQTVSPETQIHTREQDLINAAAPDPNQRAAWEESMYQRYLNAMMAARSGPQGGNRGYAGPQGGTGAYAPIAPPTRSASPVAPTPSASEPWWMNPDYVGFDPDTGQPITYTGEPANGPLGIPSGTGVFSTPIGDWSIDSQGNIKEPWMWNPENSWNPDLVGPEYYD